LIYLGLKR